MKHIKGRFILLILLLLVWFLLSFPFQVQEAIAGIIVSILILLIPLPNTDIYADLKLNPKALFNLFMFLLVFLYLIFRKLKTGIFRFFSPIVFFRNIQQV